MSDTGSYIVVFKAGTSKEKIDEAASKVESSGAPLQALDHLDFIESDGEVSIVAKNLGIK
ncbi:hypothetical protein HK099_005344 [Clydaea vesicula]|uniref:Uncharacterized protein n=1 Tax=Clydaea vesicula TaxID=447962 RepID=A0AAD5U6M3_9FUNG|nr:hypothetical protein HK099_005344 [Clydaea vesicula]